MSHVVLAVGLDGLLEGEGNDRLASRFPNGLGLPGMQQQLIDAVAAVGKPTTVVVVAGGAIYLPPNPNVTSIVYAFYPGIETGTGFARLHGGPS